MSGWWSWVLSIVGITGFILAGRKVWWSWYINLGCQALWLAYALTTKQYGFLIATIVYIFVFGKNALAWTKEHRNTAIHEPIGKIDEIIEDERGLTVRGHLHYRSLGPEWFIAGDVISYKGENFYRACDKVVRELPDGGQSHCVKRAGHPSVMCEDFCGEMRIQPVA